MLTINLNINWGQHQHQLRLSIIIKTSCPYTMLLYSGPASIFPSIHINQPQNEDLSIAFLTTGLVAATTNSQYTGFLFLSSPANAPTTAKKNTVFCSPIARAMATVVLPKTTVYIPSTSRPPAVWLAQTPRHQPRLVAVQPRHVTWVIRLLMLLPVQIDLRWIVRSLRMLLTYLGN